MLSFIRKVIFDLKYGNLTLSTSWLSMVFLTHGQSQFENNSLKSSEINNLQV